MYFCGSVILNSPFILEFQKKPLQNSPSDCGMRNASRTCTSLDIRNGLIVIGCSFADFRFCSSKRSDRVAPRTPIAVARFGILIGAVPIIALVTVRGVALVTRIARAIDCTRLTNSMCDFFAYFGSSLCKHPSYGPSPFQCRVSCCHSLLQKLLSRSFTQRKRAEKKESRGDSKAAAFLYLYTRT